MDLHEPPDIHHFRAAIGWLELGNHLEANEELEQISPLNRAHPEVLELRWQIYHKAGRWDVCLQLAESLVIKRPDSELGYVLVAQSFSGMKDYRKAYDYLSPCLGKFPDSMEVSYDMACYACLLGNLEEAMALLDRAFTLDKTNTAKLKSLEDPDLAALWGNSKSSDKLSGEI